MVQQSQLVNVGGAATCGYPGVGEVLLFTFCFDILGLVRIGGNWPRRWPRCVTTITTTKGKKFCIVKTKQKIL